MYEGNDDASKKPDVQENYAGAVSSGASRVEPHKVTRADLIASSGMSVYGTGTALMRLGSEWNSGSIPALRELPKVKVIAQQVARRRVEAEIKEAGEPTKLSEKRALLDRTTVQASDMDLAAAELSRLHAQATDWQTHEAKLRFQRLKTLPTVRAALLHWVKERDWDDGEYLVAKVLQYFLSPYCPACGGSGVREFAGNNRRGAGKACSKCRDHAVRGEVNIPCYGRGRALLAHIRSCVARAAKDVGEGAWKFSRGDQSEEDRAKHRHHEQIEKLQRADAEAKEEILQDTAAVAAHFRDSMVKTRRKT